MRWVGIDEAGYGPNLGPMVMTAVVAESGPARRATSNARAELDLWRDLAATVDRAGGDPARLWVDDSKAIMRGGKGRNQLERACLAAVHAAAGTLPQSFGDLLGALAIDADNDAELTPWQSGADDAPAWPDREARSAAERLAAGRPLAPPDDAWRITAVRSVIVGPSRFNAGLQSHGLKSAVHFDAFVRLLHPIWALAADGVPTAVNSDKHGGRHFYLPALSRLFPTPGSIAVPKAPTSAITRSATECRRLEL